MKNTKKKKRIFTKKNYLSGDGMLTTIWGPSLWHYLHTISFNYPIKPSQLQKKKYKEFIVNLKHTLPCRHCRENLVKNLKNKPLTKKTLNLEEHFRVIYELHERINRQLGKKWDYLIVMLGKDMNILGLVALKNINDLILQKKKKDIRDVRNRYMVKAKCIMKIIPNNIQCQTLTIDKECKKKLEYLSNFRLIG